MSITDLIHLDKMGEPEPTGLPGLYKKLYLSLIIILVALLSFGVGRITGGGGTEPIRIEYDKSMGTANLPQTASAISATKPLSLPTTSGSIYASSKGEKYHYAHCSGWKRISEANLLTFPTAEAAEASGYTLALNCSPK